MRELIKDNQLVTIVPQDFKKTNKGRVLEVSPEGFRMELKYKPDGLIVNHICDFYSFTDNGYLYFESYIQNLENNVITIANPVKHRFLQRRKFTRIKFIEDLELTNGDVVHKIRTLDQGPLRLSNGLRVPGGEPEDRVQHHRLRPLHEEAPAVAKGQLLPGEHAHALLREQRRHAGAPQTAP